MVNRWLPKFFLDCFFLVLIHIRSPALVPFFSAPFHRCHYRPLVRWGRIWLSPPLRASAASSLPCLCRRHVLPLQPGFSDTKSAATSSLPSPCRGHGSSTRTTFLPLATWISALFDPVGESIIGKTPLRTFFWYKFTLKLVECMCMSLTSIWILVWTSFKGYYPMVCDLHTNEFAKPMMCVVLYWRNQVPRGMQGSTLMWTQIQYQCLIWDIQFVSN